jgi:exopolyphosphatase/guanosine-5'-triphosphate,3'-diphosphate pyrophosphatase
VDIGGGSTELSVGDAPTTSRGSRAPDVVTRSLEIGCVRVTERYLLHDPPCAEEISEARAAVGNELESARAELPALRPNGLLVGLAGTVSTLACLRLGVAVYERERIHHSVLSREDVERWLHTLAAERAASRLEHHGMVRGREDVIVGGIIVLAEVMAIFERDECLVSEDDILDGLAASLLR